MMLAILHALLDVALIAWAVSLAARLAYATNEIARRNERLRQQNAYQLSLGG